MATTVNIDRSGIEITINLVTSGSGVKTVDLDRSGGGITINLQTT